MLHTLVRWLLIGSVTLFIFSFWHRNDLPQPAQLPPQLSQAPIQIQVNQPVIDKEVGGISYHIGTINSISEMFVCCGAIMRSRACIKSLSFGMVSLPVIF